MIDTKMTKYDTQLKCPECGANCYIWLEGDVTDVPEKPIDKGFVVYCINDCGSVGSIEGTITLKKETLKMVKRRIY